MNSKSVTTIALLFLILAVAGAYIFNQFAGVVTALVIAMSVIMVAIMFLVIASIMKNQETMIKLLEAQNEKLNDITAKNINNEK